MDKYRPKRPTTLALFPQLPQAGTQDSINNNSLGKKDSWKDSHSSSPHITGDLTPPDIQPKPEDKVRRSTRRPAPKPPTANGANGKSNTQAAAAAADTRARPQEKQGSGGTHSNPTSTQRSQRKAAGGGVGKAGGRGATTMKERILGDLRGKDGVTAGKEEKKGGRLCEESRAKEKEKNGHQRPKETNGLKTKGVSGKGKLATKGANRGGGIKLNNMLCNQEVYLPAMVVPRTPVAPRKQDKTQDQGQNHDRTQDNPPALSRSSSEGGSNRMSLSSDTEGPPPGPLNPSLSNRTNPDISEEEGEGDPTPCMNIQNGPTRLFDGNKNTEMDCKQSEVFTGRGRSENNSEVNRTKLTQGECAAAQTVPKSEASAGLNYDSVKYTLVVDEHAQLELISIKDCFHGLNEHNDDSDAETVYQSANEEEDPEYKEERKRREKEKQEDRRKEDEKRRHEEEENLRRREEDVRRRREEEVKRRREVVARICKQSKVISTITSEEEESNGGKEASRSKKFLNLFTNKGSNYSATGAASFGMFSCVLDGVEREQSHRAAYRFVPRHADELHLETDDPVLVLNQCEDLWCQGYNMRTGATGIFPAFYAVKVAKDSEQVVQRDGWMEQFVVRFLGSVQVPIHTGNDVLCAAMHKVACNRRSAGQPPPNCVLDVSVKGIKITVQDQCHSAHRGEQCSHFFQLKNISFCGCHPKHSKYFGFITKHPDQQRFACHVMMSDTSLYPLAVSVGKAFQQYYKENIGYSCPTEDIFIE
ncbi:C-Jun-amino-terminal kinase-interacting protein 1a [Cheilinus undulatus]|uniref:C-Jun-amino-terminal kinase-interacting protein 1a n=1 Tax=Cheilinus undulatus TaxID=241271 RepID=UPI001BD43984|nr:C-Jun-amino-terminal kinase-interacting protein 1a [Cheilinus undulatus]